MHTGHLVASQEDFKMQTFSMLEKHKAKPPFNSALLQNTLQQKSMSPTYVLSPDTLVEPLHKRKTQLNAYPTTQLHLRGQRAAIGMGAGIVASASFGWAGWLGWLSGSGFSASTEGTLLHVLSSIFNIGIEPSTAIGLSVLGTLASIRWTVGKWERAKKLWWEDWIRVCQGLERDLKVNPRITCESTCLTRPLGDARKSYERESYHYYRKRMRGTPTTSQAATGRDRKT